MVSRSRRLARPEGVLYTGAYQKKGTENDSVIGKHCIIGHYIGSGRDDQEMTRNSRSPEE